METKRTFSSRLNSFSLLFATFVVSLFVASPFAYAQQKRLVEKRHPVVAQVKGIDNTNSSGVSRIAVYLLSMPNTSSRIDSVSLINNNKKFAATDIDGVDFNRYFQWEEEGEIPVEVDFPRQKKFYSDAQVVFHTVHGDVSAPIKTKKAKQKK